MSEPFVCPRCDGAELELEDGQPGWLRCSYCTARYLEADQVDKRRRALNRERTADARACFFAEQNRPHEQGGSRSKNHREDKLGTVILRPAYDEGEVSHKVEQLVRKDNVIRVKGLECTSEEAMDALAQLFLEEEAS